MAREHPVVEGHKFALNERHENNDDDVRQQKEPPRGHDNSRSSSSSSSRRRSGNRTVNSASDDHNHWRPWYFDDNQDSPSEGAIKPDVMRDQATDR